MENVDLDTPRHSPKLLALATTLLPGVVSFIAIKVWGDIPDAVYRLETGVAYLLALFLAGYFGFIVFTSRRFHIITDLVAFFQGIANGRTLPLALGAAVLQYGLFLLAVHAATAGMLAVGEPAMLQGRPQYNDPGLDEGRKLVQTRLASVPGTSHSFSRVYGTSNDDAIYVGGANGSYNDFPSRLNDVFTVVEDGKVRDIWAVDPGPLGGAAACGNLSAFGIDAGVCAWVDRGTIGELVFYHSDADRAARLLPATRAELEQKG
ncbi:hypothetical protein ACGFJ7_17835 [Actinoplanes sp. NPDC048988]|uniref:hypothetical protein n=1 Tax=Actinoplanes sp. NPDC048988 TaxID=3363901 RepID=UPI003721F68A